MQAGCKDSSALGAAPTELRERLRRLAGDDSRRSLTARFRDVFDAEWAPLRLACPLPMGEPERVRKEATAGRVADTIQKDLDMPLLGSGQSLQSPLLTRVMRPSEGFRAFAHALCFSWLRE